MADRVLRPAVKLPGAAAWAQPYESTSAAPPVLDCAQDAAESERDDLLGGDGRLRAGGGPNRPADGPSPNRTAFTSQPT